MASAAGIRAGGAFVEIFAKDGAFHQAMTRVQNRLRATGKAMQAVGQSMAMGAGMIGLPMAMAMRTFASFDDAIRATAAVTGSFGEQGAANFQKLSDRARELGATTSFTAIQVANLMTELGRAGFNPDQIIAMTGAVLDLSRATGTDATVAAGIMAATLRQFNLEATDAGRVADVLTMAANATFNQVTDLGEALKYAGPVAAQLGMSLEDTAAILGTLGNVGIQGSMAGTTLRRLSVISAAEADKLQAIFGVAFKDAAGNARPLVDVLGEIAAATNGLPTAQRTALFAEAFGLLGITGAQAIGSVAADTRELADQLRGAAGTASTTAREMDAGLGGAIRIMLSAIEGLALAFGDALAPSIQWLAVATTKLADVFRALTKQFPLAAQLIAGVTGGVFALGVAAIIGGYALQVFGAAINVATKAVMLLATPMGLVAAAIVASVALILTAAYQLSPAFKREADAIMAAITRLDFSSAWEVMNLNLAIALVQMAQAFENAWATVKNTAAATAAFLGDKLTEGLDRFMGLFGADILTLQAAFEKLGLYFRAAFDWKFAVGGLRGALAEVDRRLAEERKKNPTADGRAQARADARQAQADARQASDDARNAGYEATIEALRDDLDRARDRALGLEEDKKAAEAQAKDQKPTTPAATANAAARSAQPSTAGATIGTFSDAVAGRLGAGPTLQAAEQTAANTAKLVDIETGIAGQLEGLANQGLGNQEGVAAGLPGAVPSNANNRPNPDTLLNGVRAAAPAPANTDAATKAGDNVVNAIASLNQTNQQQLSHLETIAQRLSNLGSLSPAFA